jgi:hypothetical protein
MSGPILLRQAPSKIKTGPNPSNQLSDQMIAFILPRHPVQNRHTARLYLVSHSSWHFAFRLYKDIIVSLGSGCYCHGHTRACLIVYFCLAYVDDGELLKPQRTVDGKQKP